jgi:hypothetical protein
MSAAPYTKRGRLADVLALIQVLSLDEATRRSEEGLQKELKGTPISASDWSTVAKEHREFFRVNPTSQSPISLVARYVLPHEEEERRPPLDPQFVAVLIQTAINIHDRQVQAKEWWKPWISFAAAIVAAVIGAAVSIVTFLLSGARLK